MTLLALALLTFAAAPAPAPVWKLTLHHEERLTWRKREQSTRDDNHFDGVARLTVTSMKGARADAVTVEGITKSLPRITVREDAGAPVVVFEGDPNIFIGKLLRRALGRLVVEDLEREAMSSCTPDTREATHRWLQLGVARITGAEPTEVRIEDLELSCKATKTGTRIDVQFTGQVPQATIAVTMKVKGNLVVDKNVWFTQWKLEGPVHALGEGDVEVKGTFASSLTAAR